eukprot:3332702-Amphidinium_carterae.1
MSENFEESLNSNHSKTTTLTMSQRQHKSTNSACLSTNTKHPSITPVNSSRKAFTWDECTTLASLFGRAAVLR